MRCVQATKQQCWRPEDDSALPGGRTWQKERNDLAEAKRVKTAAQRMAFCQTGLMVELSLRIEQAQETGLFKIEIDPISATSCRYAPLKTLKNLSHQT